MVWVENGVSNTLTVAGDTISVTNTNSTNHNVVLINNLASGQILTKFRFDNDSGSNYAQRRSLDGATDVTAVSQTELAYNMNGTDTVPNFSVTYIINISADEKLILCNSINQNTVGATTAPNRLELVGKWTNTTNQFSVVSAVNTGTGDFATDSNVTAFGTD